MNKSPDEAVAFVKQLAAEVEEFANVERVVAPTFLALGAVSTALRGSSVQVAAQDAHWEDSGAYTSQVSVDMLRPFVDYIIVGHSECRAYLNETDAKVNKTARAILASGLRPIIAVGESLAQNEAGETVAFVRSQVSAALDGISAEDMDERSHCLRTDLGNWHRQERERRISGFDNTGSCARYCARTLRQ